MDGWKWSTPLTRIQAVVATTIAAMLTERPLMERMVRSSKSVLRKQTAAATAGSHQPWSEGIRYLAYCAKPTAPEAMEIGPIRMTCQRKRKLAKRPKVNGPKASRR